MRLQARLITERYNATYPRRTLNTAPDSRELSGEVGEGAFIEPNFRRDMAGTSASANSSMRTSTASSSTSPRSRSGQLLSARRSGVYTASSLDPRNRASGRNSNKVAIGNDCWIGRTRDDQPWRHARERCRRRLGRGSHKKFRRQGRPRRRPRPHRENDIVYRIVPG